MNSQVWLPNKKYAKYAICEAMYVRIVLEWMNIEKSFKIESDLDNVKTPSFQ